MASPIWLISCCRARIRHSRRPAASRTRATEAAVSNQSHAMPASLQSSLARFRIVWSSIFATLDAQKVTIADRSSTVFKDSLPAGPLGGLSCRPNPESIDPVVPGQLAGFRLALIGHVAECLADIWLIGRRVPQFSTALRRNLTVSQTVSIRSSAIPVLPISQPPLRTVILPNVRSPILDNRQVPASAEQHAFRAF